MEQLDFIKGLEISQDCGGQEAYIMYHGTTLENANSIKQNGFVPSTKGMLGPGVYVTRSFQKAATYPLPYKLGEVRVILRLRVRVGKVKRIDYQGHPLQKTWHQAGYDTAWVPPNCGMVASGLEEDCVWDPKRIDVLEVLNNDGPTKNASTSRVKRGPFKCVRVAPSLAWPRLTPGSPMLDFPCPIAGPPMLDYPHLIPRPGYPMVDYPFPIPGPPMYCTDYLRLIPGTPIQGIGRTAPQLRSPTFGIPIPGLMPPPFYFP